MLSLKYYKVNLMNALAISFLLIMSTNLKGQQLYDVEWDPANILNCVIYPTGSNNLINTGPPNWGNSGALSLNTIPPGSPGIMYYYITNMTDVQIGLTYNSFDPNPISIPFSFRLENGMAYVFEQGNFVLSLGSYNPNMNLKLVRDGSTIYYYYNGFEVHRAFFNPNVPLNTNVALKNSNSVISLVEMSIDVPVIIPDPPDPIVPIETIYHPMSNSLDGAIYILPSNGTLRITFVDKYFTTNNIKWKLYSKSSTNPEYAYDDGSSGSLVKTLGDNRIEFAYLSPFLDLNTIYIFEITGEKGKKQYIKIKR